MPRERLDIVDASGNGAIKIGNRDADGATAGTIRWTGTAFEGYNGTGWVPLGGGGLGQPAWNSGWIVFAAGATHTYNFPEITGVTADDLFVDVQVLKNSSWGIPAGISNIVTDYCGQGYGLAYSNLKTSSIQIFQGANPGGTITHYRVRIWKTI
jgi:hypothetical protein